MKFRARNNYLINWPEYTLLRITICFILGIVISDLISLDMEAFLVSLGLLFLLTINLNINGAHSRKIIKLNCVFIYLVAMMIGFSRGELQKIDSNPTHFTNCLEYNNKLVGRVAGELKKKKRVSTTIEVLGINGSPGSGKLLVYFGRSDTLVNVRKGDILLLEGRIQKLKDNSNPRAFNYKDYLKYKGITAQLFLKDGAFQCLAKGKPNSIQNIAARVRWWALTIFENRLDDSDQLATASAMVLGYRENLSKDLYTSFSETGAVHVLAVSGLHVGIICMLFLVLFRQIKSKHAYFKIFKMMSLLAVVWIYAMITGASPAVLRASVMFSILLIGKLWFKGANIYNALAFSVIVLLMYNPYLLFQLSFQFSYLALISILFFQPRIENLYVVRHWLMKRIWQLTSVSIAAQFLVFPISIYYFNAFPTYFILSGVAAVFLATFILGLGLLLICVDRIYLIGDVIASCYSNLLEMFLWIISGIQSLPFTKVDGVFLSPSSVVALYILILAGMFLLATKPQSYKDVFHKKRKRKKWSRFIIIGCILFLVNNNLIYSYRIKNHAELVIYDISKGSCIDLFVGNNLFSFVGNEHDFDKINFAANAYRIYRGSPKNHQISNGSVLYQDASSIMDNGLISFKGYKVLVLGYVDDPNCIPAHSDIVVLTHNCDIDLGKLLDIHHTKLVVIDNSMAFRKKQKYLEICSGKKVAVHDVYQEGVFIL